ncbi:MAG: alcohol dehydrogenase catalytic domain-containing protein, partial [Acidobacteriota bacterium]
MATQISNPETHVNTQLPATMRAAVYRGINDMRVETVPVPRIGAGEVLIKVATCGICGTDLKKIHMGSHSAPRIFGHEMAGVIVAAGPGVNGYAVGDRVMTFHHVPCGQCYYCRKQTPAQCPLYKKTGVTAGFEPSGGGFAHYIRVMDFVVQNRGVVRIPDHVPFEQAAFVEPLNTVMKGVKMLNLAPDDTVLVIGQGPIGLMHAALARRTGARVLTSDLFPERHAIAARFGLTEPIHAGQENVVERVFAATDGRGADAVILAVGGNTLIRTAMEAARPGGKVMLFA